MTAPTPTDINTMELEATSHFSLHQYTEAEQVYRRIMNVQISMGRPQVASREQYNLAAVLVQKEKYDEARPLLREVLAALQARENRDQKHFIQQEAGTMRLLVETVQDGEEKKALTDEAVRLEVLAEGKAE